MRICVKDLSGSGSKHDPLSVSYVVVGGLFHAQFIIVLWIKLNLIITYSVTLKLKEKGSIIYKLNSMSSFSLCVQKWCWEEFSAFWATEYLATNFKVLFCFADLNPCLDVHCPSFGVCKTFSAHEARCVCYEDCPSYHDPVCTANGTTYDNKCWHELYYCRGLENNLVYHPGSCEGKKGFWC